MATFPTRTTGTTAGRPPRTSAARPVSAWAFAGVAVTSFGGPLALAALYAPGIVAGSAGASAGLDHPARPDGDLPGDRRGHHRRGRPAGRRPGDHPLWLSQLIVFAVYPRFAARQHHRPLPAWGLTAAATAFGVYGLWATIQHAS